jgi:hypothetical protein
VCIPAPISEFSLHITHPSLLWKTFAEKKVYLKSLKKRKDYGYFFYKTSVFYPWEGVSPKLFEQNFLKYGGVGGIFMARRLQGVGVLTKT